MARYELRTCTLCVGKMAEVVKRYSEGGYPALEKGGQSGYLQSDGGTLSQLVHSWKFDDDADRRRDWKAVFANTDFMAFAAELRPSIMTQVVKLLLATPWGPHP